ncbi:MAG TPA: hypothetical protein VF163_11675 [Micromonosporaceae bacterium]
MSYTVVGGNVRKRPAVVTAASVLLYCAAAAQLASVAISLASLGPVRQAIEDEYAGQPDAETIQVATTIGIGLGVVVPLLMVAGCVVLAVMVGKGKNPARIVTWVLAGVSLLCYGCGLLGTAVGNLVPTAGTDPAAGDIEGIEAAVPAWQQVASTVLSVLLLALMLVIIVLLALPAANDYFRKEQEVWLPPTWPDPAAGGYPPAGYPPAGYPPADYPAGYLSSGDPSAGYPPASYPVGYQPSGSPAGAGYPPVQPSSGPDAQTSQPSAPIGEPASPASTSPGPASEPPSPSGQPPVPPA